MKPLPLFLSLACVGLTSSLPAANPITPPGVYLADPSAHVWSDGKLYVYGSRDESPNYYCSRSHDVLVTSDLVNWQLHERVFATTGPGADAHLQQSFLYAPDAAQFGDKYHLYYCRPSDKGVEGVAFSDSPTGPFRSAKPLDVAGIEQIDPCVFVDDDGSAYFIWGQFSASVARLKPGGTELDLSTLRRGVVDERNHFFHEGAYMVKRNGVYYLIYADISRAQRPTCLGYSTGPTPFGPFTYRGVIIDNSHSDPAVWNNHGSLVKFKDRWYVFYHRATHNSVTMRRACVEPIVFREDGSIPEVEMTSQGAGAPLDAFSPIPAALACLLHGDLRLEQAPKDIGGDQIAQAKSGDRAAFKYVNFGKGAQTVEVDVQPGVKDGWIEVSLDMPWNPSVARVAVPAGTKRVLLSAPIKDASGVRALWLTFGDGFSDKGAFYGVRFRAASK